MANTTCRECGAEFNSQAELAAHAQTSHPSGSTVSKIPGASTVGNAARGAEEKLTGRGSGAQNTMRDDMDSEERNAGSGRLSENNDVTREAHDSSSWQSDEHEAENDAQRARRDLKPGDR